MKKFLIGSGIITILGAFTINNNHSIATRVSYQDSTPVEEMKQYWLVFLLKGTNRVHDSISSAMIQAAHIRNIDRLAKEGKIIMAGPMGYNRDLRGIFIMDGKDSAEIAGYIKTDSAVATGRLKFEIHPWWTAKGKYEFK
jgi:uncharacterized protein